MEPLRDWTRQGGTYLVFLNDRFEPVPEHEATLAKERRADGTILFARLAPPLGKFAADQLRDEHGKFAPEDGGRQMHAPRGDHAILTAENPAGRMLTPDENAQRNAALRAELVQRGLVPVPVTGSYTDPESGQRLIEHSYLVPGMNAADAKVVGEKYGQNSVISREGYHDIKTGQLYPANGYVSVGKGPYTELPGGRRLRARIDWQHPVNESMGQPGQVRKARHPAHIRKARSYWWEIAPFSVIFAV